MITEIGIVAGEIWQYLDKHDNNALLSEILKQINRPKEIALLSMGWLAREGHINLIEEKDDFRAHLTHR